ncbi:hypothetical protein NT04LM_2880, partial [Listeria monocytogenes FSL F2-208]
PTASNITFTASAIFCLSICSILNSPIFLALYTLYILTQPNFKVNLICLDK